MCDKASGPTRGRKKPVPPIRYAAWLRLFTPEMQAELLGAVGQAYDDMGANALAVDYANRRLQILQDVPDVDERIEEVEKLRSL